MWWFCYFCFLSFYLLPLVLRIMLHLFAYLFETKKEYLIVLGVAIAYLTYYLMEAVKVSVLCRVYLLTVLFYLFI